MTWTADDSRIPLQVTDTSTCLYWWGCMVFKTHAKSNMDKLKIIILSEAGQAEKEKHHMIHLFVESKIWHKWTYLWNRNRIMDIENRLVVAKGEGVGGGMEWEAGVSRCKPLYIEWINNKVLLYSTENYIQYPVINHSEKEYKKRMCIYIYIYMYNRITLLYGRN